MLKFVYNVELASQMLDTIVENVNLTTTRIVRFLRKRLVIRNETT